MRSSALPSQACLLQFGSPGRGEASERLAPLFPGADGYPAEVDQGPRLRVRAVSFSDTSPQPNLPCLATTRSRESEVVKAHALADQS